MCPEVPASTRLIAAAVFLVFCSIVQAKDMFYADDNDACLQYGTKTAYELARGKEGIAKVPGCRAVQLWMVARHGTRWPAAHAMPEFAALEDIKHRVISNHNQNKGSLCKQALENLKTWSFRMDPEQGNTLTLQGRQDLYQLGKRVRSYFPELFNAAYSADKFVFRHTDTPRTKESAEYFYRGVFGMNFEDPAPSLPPPLADDRLIHPFNNCPVWEAQGSASKKEKSKFEKSEWMANVIHRVSQRLGFDNDLTKDNVMDIYGVCRYEKAWDVSGVSPWCAAFTKEDIMVLEYAEDLKYFYKSGPGDPINLRLACPLVKDLYTRFSGVEARPDAAHPTAMFYFSHSSMIDMLSARLGLTDDSLPLTADNFPQQANRQFRSSKIIPFTGNVLAVLYDCPGSQERFQTTFYQTEDIVRYPGCSDGLCTWNHIKQKFASFTQDPSCEDHSFCNPSKGGTTTTENTGLVATFWRKIFKTCLG